jgi:hypothetical protein
LREIPAPSSSNVSAISVSRSDRKFSEVVRPFNPYPLHWTQSFGLLDLS